MIIEKNKEYVVDIVDNGYEGEGIAKIDGYIIFIPNAIKGEKIKILIVKVNKNFAYGKIVNILKSSEKRVDIDCNTYISCGGCNLRHINYSEGLKIKKEIVKNCLFKTTKKEVIVNEVIGMEKPLFYRNKLIYPVGKNKKGNIIAGVYANRSHRIIENNICLIQSLLSQNIVRDIVKLLNEQQIQPYDENNRLGYIRHIIIKEAKNNNEIMVILVCNEKNITNIDREKNKNFEKTLIKKLNKEYSNIKSIVKNINNEDTNVILGRKNIILYGESFIKDLLGEYYFKISPNSFYQVNPEQTVKLYNKAIEFGNLKKEDIVLDLYCGIGTISIFLAKYVKKVVGIEIVEDAIRDAKENAKINKIENVDFYAGDVKEILPKVLETNEKPNIIYVDPPRKGLDKDTIEIILSVMPEKIVYISCNPATLARDLDLLQEYYEIKEVQPVDMFCYSSHVECCTLLELKNCQ